MKLLHINTTLNSCSHGRIAEGIGSMAIANGHKSYYAAGYCTRPSSSEIIKIGSDLDRKVHGLKTRLFDRHGFGSLKATKTLIENIKKIDPDIIHLHNIHGYYLHIGVMFDYLKLSGKPILWTLHDCWPFTGHCSHFDRINCNKWQNQCFNCPNRNTYPRSWFWDNSRKNYKDKEAIFTGLKNMIIVTPSEWLSGHLKNSFLSGYASKVINNGIDLDIFRNKVNKSSSHKHKISKKYILGVASIWTQSKGLEDFIKLRKILDKDLDIVIVGLSKKQIKYLPEGIRGIIRTEEINELVELYSGAYALVNPTYADNFPSVNIEALACGTPIITYDTGGSPEAISHETGIVVTKGDILGIKNAIIEIVNRNRQEYIVECRERALKLYNLETMFKKYIYLYEQLISSNSSQLI